MIDEPRRANAAYQIHDSSGAALQQGEALAVADEEALKIGPLTVSYLDADALRAADYQIEIGLWPEGRLVLSRLGRRYATFVQELKQARNRARVAGLLAHGITIPDVFTGALLGDGASRPAEFQVYPTHLSIVPEDGDPWQLPLGTVTSSVTQDDPPGVAFDTDGGRTLIGQLGRQRDAFQRAVAKQLDAQACLLAETTGQRCFADGLGIPPHRINGFDQLRSQFTAPERESGAQALLSRATAEPRFGLAQLLDPDNESLLSPRPLPDHWASFLLIPVRELTVLELLAGPSAATYLFRGGIEEVNRDLQRLHFRRSPLALTAQQAELTPINPHRLALRRLAALRRLRESTVARILHTESWADQIARAIG